MSPRALAVLGPTLAMATRAIEAAVRPQRVYCAAFSEQTRSIHFHLFPRTQWLTAKYFTTHPHDTEISGPLLLDWARRAFQHPLLGSERDEKIQEIREFLSAA